MTLSAFLVEDNEVILTNLVQTLKELANVDIVGSAPGEVEAVDWLLENPDRWRLTIVDLFLKNGNGLGVLATCRVRKPGQRMVVLSNYATDSMRARCIDVYGADAVFDKSTEIDALVDYCRQHQE